MSYQLKKVKDIFSIADKSGIALQVYPEIGDCGIVLAQTEIGHENEILHKTSTFHYLLLQGFGEFVIAGKNVEVNEGDLISIKPNTPFYYKGTMKLLLVTNPPWTEEGETLVKENIL